MNVFRQEDDAISAVGLIQVGEDAIGVEEVGAAADNRDTTKIGSNGLSIVELQDCSHSVLLKAIF